MPEAGAHPPVLDGKIEIGGTVGSPELVAGVERLHRAVATPVELALEAGVAVEGEGHQLQDGRQIGTRRAFQDGLFHSHDRPPGETCVTSYVDSTTQTRRHGE